MARMQVETCMFCGGSPCTCNKPEPKTRVPRVAKPKVPVVAPTEPVVSASVGEPIVTPRRRAPLRATPRPVVDEEPGDQEEYKRALTILCRSGLVCADDIEKHKADLNMEPIAARALIWRKRREEALHVRH